MDDERVAGLVALFVILLVLVFGITISTVAGCGAATIAERDEAIKAGVGRWEINEKTGDKRFVYGVPKEAK